MRRRRERGAALVLMVVLGAGLMVLSALSLNMSLVRSAAGRTQLEEFTAHQIAESGVAEALAKLKDGGVQSPRSSSSSGQNWVPFGDGAFYYSSTYDPVTEISRIRAWGRVPTSRRQAAAKNADVPPDDPTWNGDGWLVKGIELTVQSGKFVPEFPMYFGNGGIERPLGGFEWSSTTDPADPSTWGTVTSSPSSYQASSVPFEASALDHPIDYLVSGGAPLPASGSPHPYQIWAAQNPIGQTNIDAWFNNSAGTGDAMSTIDPPPTSTYYDPDPASPDHAYPVRSDIPDVQDWSSSLWNTYGSSNDPSVHKLSGGDLGGTYGDLANPSVTFVTGGLNVPPGQTFKGSGILVIRDDYDPNVDTNNTPGIRANLSVKGKLEWTGLVIIAGWAPSVDVDPGGEVAINGAFFGEDSVQSGGEVSLDSATIIMTIDGPFRVTYSSALFNAGGLLYDQMPDVLKRVIGIRDISRESTLIREVLYKAGQPVM